MKKYALLIDTQTLDNGRIVPSKSWVEKMLRRFLPYKEISWIESLARLAVKNGGGQWVGIQEYGPYDLVLFSSLQTGSTLALETTEITADNVRRSIAESNAKFNFRRNYAKLTASRNGEVLQSFIDYCVTHPDQRFWQALRNWSAVAFIFASGVPLCEIDMPTAGVVEDTFYWEGRDQ